MRANSLERGRLPLLLTRFCAERFGTDTALVLGPSLAAFGAEPEFVGQGRCIANAVSQESLEDGRSNAFSQEGRLPLLLTRFCAEHFGTDTALVLGPSRAAFGAEPEFVEQGRSIANALSQESLEDGRSWTVAPFSLFFVRVEGLGSWFDSSGVERDFAVKHGCTESALVPLRCDANASPDAVGPSLDGGTPFTVPRWTVFPDGLERLGGSWGSGVARDDWSGGTESAIVLAATLVAGPW